MLRAKSGVSNKRSAKSNQSAASPLSKAAWTRATIDERRRFVDGIGVDSLFEALSLSFRAEVKRRIAAEQPTMTSALGETIAAGVRQALSLQKAAKAEDDPATGVASALNAINNKLAAVGFDLNNITKVIIDPAATQRRAA
jgi:hypothetical protein